MHVSFDRLKKSLLPLSLTFALSACQTPPAPIAETPPPTPSSTPVQNFEGVTLTVLTEVGPTIYEPLNRRAPDFERLTGVNINIVTVPFGQLYQTILDDLSQGTKKYDLIVFAPQWMVDFAAPGYLEELDGRIANDPALEWNDIAPFFREFSTTYDRKIYTIPLDGDFQMVYYRSDLLEQEGLNPPKTWDDYLKIAQAFHGKDLNGDGEPDYGSCMSKKPNAQSYWMFGSILSPFIQSQGTRQGIFFDPETMKPLVNNEAFAKALEIYKQTTQYAPANELELTTHEVHPLFASGRCALTLDWGDTGTIVINPEISQVIDKVGADIAPGSREILDRETGALVTCDKATCPYAINGVNHAPYAAFGGWSGAVNAASNERRKEAAYAFLSYMSQPAQANVDVTIGGTGFNPYRFSQYSKQKLWIDAGMSAEAAQRYLGAIGLSLSNANVVLDLRVPYNNRYQQDVLDPVLGAYLRDEITTEQAIQQIEQGWEKITDEVGREAQRNAYKASIGVQ
ncbi:ABC transporter substrate-binding protein [Roseofilum capinflatum]|uniref:Extracellular solute-binding protein n=1 Tax=Roseofilum capinflatum BLCC-M114 TaxID=3022440 RepID=A0ABT7B8C1_9CYAN|nr:extracellular solute-binding protein [Roseofilum capinflatum]MDJ1174533.1 extracellular solute-binding protein [Roseofilum capinflatum BLCC-M114]